MTVKCCVAVVGSSGGGAATLGHTDPSQLLRMIHNELENVDEGAILAHALFVSLHNGCGLDSANKNKDIASLYCVSLHSPTNGLLGRSSINVQLVETDILSKVNDRCRQMDQSLAQAIRHGKIQGLVLVSVDVDIHSETLQAASDMNLPVTGSGGTSLSAAAATFGIRLLGNAGGSVATTSYTRAVSYTHALATAWQRRYNPFADTSALALQPQWKSVLNSCLPAFWAVCLTLRCLAKMVGNEVLSPFQTEAIKQLSHQLQTLALPTVCCVVMATSCAPHQGSTVAIASSIAAMACSQSILAGLVAGWIVAFLVERVLFCCIVWDVPASMTNLIVAGGLGTSVAVLITPLVPVFCQVTKMIRWALLTSMEGQVRGVGFLFGCVFCYGSKVGYYHSLYLPVILVEMELGGASILGSMDLCTLVLVSAGICTANLVMLPSTDKSNRELCRRGAFTNMFFGDFIEAAYPCMERSVLVNLAGYLASGLSVEILAQNPHKVLSSAYLPLPVSIWLANDWRRLGFACFVAFGVSFMGTLLDNLVFRNRRKSKDI